MKFRNMLALSASAIVFAAGAAVAQDQDAESTRENAVSRVLGTVTVTATKKRMLKTSRTCRLPFRPSTATRWMR